MGKPSRSIKEPAGGTAPESVNWRDFEPSWLPGGEGNALATEHLTYRDSLDELLEHAGQFVAIKSDRVLGFYRDRKSALATAVAAVGPVLVKRVVETEPMRRPGNILT